MDFIQATEAMIQGRITKCQYNSLHYKIFRNKLLYFSDNTEWKKSANIGTILEIVSSNWEIVPEPKQTLYDKLKHGTVNHKDGNYQEFFYIKDVKMSLKDLMYEINHVVGIRSPDGQGARGLIIAELTRKVREIFGGDLVD